MAGNMFKIITKSSFMLTAFLMLSAFSVQENPTAQPSEERKAQDALPQSNDDMWKALSACKVHLNYENYHYTIHYTPEIKAMEGKEITVSGFILPLESTETFTHFLLSKRTPTCAFCPPGSPNEIVEVFTTTPIKWDEGIVVITGTMHFTSNPELGLFFQLKEAKSNTSISPFEKKPTSPPV
jgi:uncharacterized protein